MTERDSPDSTDNLTRRELLRRSALNATALGATIAWPQLLSTASEEIYSKPLESEPAATSNLYSNLLKSWCDGLLAHQITEIRDPALHGGIMCPACALIHGRSGDAVYPLLQVAHATGDSKYLRAALLVHEWSERQVSRADGSWVNDVTLSSWKGITVFHAIALAEALQHHGDLLDSGTRRLWTARLARAAKFLDGFMTIAAGNINYPITGAFCFAICAQVLEDQHYLDRARELAHASLDYFTPNGLLFGEGHPQTGVTRKNCRPVDLGYNVEESLPSFALYALTTNDAPALEQVIIALRAHMEFMLPDGAWDNSWGSRNYKWTWWGSRTSDGCQPAFALLAQHEPKFREVAWRNLELMAACTSNDLLYGGPHYFSHGDLPCVHHTFTHAKALATVVDRDGVERRPQPRLTLPRDEAYGLKSYPEIGTHLAAIGEWRATVTEYDFEYGEGSSGGGHASGGALSLLFHQRLGPILVASMTKYQMIEITNQQAHGDYPHMPLTARIEGVSGDQTYTSLSDFDAALTASTTPERITFNARGRLLTSGHRPDPDDVQYHLAYQLSAAAVEIIAGITALGSFASGLRCKFILPVVSRSTEAAEQVDRGTIRVGKGSGRLVIRTDAPEGFDALPKERTFNLVPGFECLPLEVAMVSGAETRITLGVE